MEGGKIMKKAVDFTLTMTYTCPKIGQVITLSQTDAINALSPWEYERTEDGSGDRGLNFYIYKIFFIIDSSYSVIFCKY